MQKWEGADKEWWQEVHADVIDVDMSSKMLCSEAAYLHEACADFCCNLRGSEIWP